MFCTACGTRNIETSSFCKQCGHRLDHAAAPKISEEAFDRALPLDEQVTALMERAYRLRKTGELSSAIRLCEEALHLNPASTSVHSLLGQIHEQMGNHDAAIHEYERVLQLNPGSIADRVKLDELRGDSLPSPLHPRAAPHIVMASPTQPMPNSRHYLGIAGVAGVLMLLGGLIALQITTRQNQTKNANLTAVGSSQTTGVNGAQTDLRSAMATPTNAAGGNTGTGSGDNSGKQVAFNNLPSNVTSSPLQSTYAAPQQQPPVIIQAPSSPRVVYMQVPASTSSLRNVGGLPSMPKANKRTSDNSDNSDRTMLPGDDGAKITINVPDKNNPDTGSAPTPKKEGTPGPKNSGNAGSFQNVPVRGDITIHKNGSGGGTGDSTTPPSTEAQSQIAIASSKFKTGDFDGAIRSYRGALAGAGNQRAYVFQQMAYCFQKIKNKADAIDSFHNAIAEYQKLESANQQVDLARAGIKVCEAGIRVCNAE